MTRIEEFPSREALTAEAKAAALAALRAGIEARGTASAALSGGSSPVPLYEALSETPFDWDKVALTLADERRVPEGSPGRNDALVRQHLLRGEAEGAAFTPLMGTKDLSSLPLPFDLVVLGMGTDGHTASLFPHCEGLREALEAPPGAICPTTPDPLPEDAPWPRLTLGRAAILGARSILLLVAGKKKRAVLEEAMRHGQVEAMPVRVALHAQDAPLRVLYAD